MVVRAAEEREEEMVQCASGIGGNRESLSCGYPQGIVVDADMETQCFQ